MFTSSMNRKAGIASQTRASVLFAAITLSACGGSGGNTPTPQTDPEVGPLVADQPLVGPQTSTTEECSVAATNQWIDARMRDAYLYYDSVPRLNLDNYDQSEALVKDLRVDPDVYSYLTEIGTNEQLVQQSTVFRFGYRINRASDGNMHFSSISGNSPMAVAGIQRGDELIAINSIDIDDITDEQYALFVRGGPDAAPDTEVTATFTVSTGGEPARDVIVTRQNFTETTVTKYGNFESNEIKAGYLNVSSFRSPTANEINRAMQYMQEENVTELILDLRYNGGGLTRVARQLASQIIGENYTGEIYSQNTHNDKYSDKDYQSKFESQPHSLGLSRIVVLATEDTASASEMLINGLSAYIDVVVIGEKTLGKPFVSSPQDYCGKRLFAMKSITTNGANNSVLGGIIPSCEVADDYLTEATSNSDPLTGAALTYLETGTCPAFVNSKRQTLAAINQLPDSEVHPNHRQPDNY